MTEQPRGLELKLEARVPARYRDDFNLTLLRRAVEAALRAEALCGPVEVSLVVAGDAALRRLNKSYRGVDSATDVLSFPLEGPEEQRVADLEFVGPPEERRRLGDVVISFPRAKRQAAEYGHSLARELGYLAVHGALHLLGYDHENETDRRVMRSKEEAALSEAGLER